MKDDGWFHFYVFILSLVGLAGFSLVAVGGFGSIMKSGRPYTAGLFMLGAGIYMASVMMSMGRFPYKNCSWYKINALVWGHITIVFALIDFGRGLIKEMF